MIGIEVCNLSTIPGISLAVLGHVGRLLAQTGDDESWAFLGEDSLAWLVLAFGAAMVVGNVLALLRPPSPDGATAKGSERGGPGERGDGTSSDGSQGRAPLGRAAVMIGIGAIAAVWGLASLLG